MVKTLERLLLVLGEQLELSAAPLDRRYDSAHLRMKQAAGRPQDIDDIAALTDPAAG